MNNFNDKQIQILEIAEKLFAEHGFDGTSVRDIAKNADINVAMISYYFGSKEKLFESLILYRAGDLRIQLENLSKEETTPVEKLNKILDLYITKIHSNKYIYRILHFELSSKKGQRKFDSFTEVKKANLITLQNIIEDGQLKGVFRKNINVALIPSTIFGTYIHFQMNRPFFEEVLELKTENDFYDYVNTELTAHIKQLIKGLLLYED